MIKTFIAGALMFAWPVSASCAGYDDLNAAISYWNQQQYDDAITWFTKAVLDGDLTTDQKRIAYLDRGLANAAKGDGKRALEDFTLAIEAQPSESLAYTFRAKLYVANGDFEKAYRDYGALLKLHPYDYSTRMIFGWMSWQLGQYQSAADAFYYFANTKPEAWLWLKLANVRLGKPVKDFTDDGSAQGLSAMQAARIWPRPILRLFQGGVSESDALSAARDQDTCEANIYVGLWRLVHNDLLGSAALLEVAKSKCGKSGEYWRIADAELIRSKGGAAK